MGKNEVLTYLLYAIGEITLVVIGILIAVSIDNWNEEKKIANLEIELLEALRNDLMENEKKIQYVISFDSSVVSKNIFLLAHLADRSSKYHDTLQYYFAELSRYRVFFPQKMAYENLKSKGLDIITNDSLRLRLVELYDETYFHNQHIGERKSQIDHDTNPVFDKRFYTVIGKGKVPINYNELKHDVEFINTLSRITDDRNGTLYQSRYMLKSTKELYKDIQTEINKL